MIVPVDVEELARDRRASLAAHHYLLEVAEARNQGRPVDARLLEQWLVRWHHAMVRVAGAGPNTEGDVVVVDRTTVLGLGEAEIVIDAHDIDG